MDDGGSTPPRHAIDQLYKTRIMFLFLLDRGPGRGHVSDCRIEASISACQADDEGSSPSKSLSVID